MRFHFQGKQAIDSSFSTASRPGHARTWNAFHGIKFASSRESTPLQRASHLIHGQLSLGAGSQQYLRIEPQTEQHNESHAENREGFGNDVSTNRPSSLPETQLECATRGPSSNDHGHSSESAHSKDYSCSDDKTFRSPLGFHIPEAKLRNAMLAEPASAASYWHFTLYQGPGGDTDKVKIHYCRNKETTEKAAQLFLDEEVVGFDIEWKANSSAMHGITKNIALIQIASEQRVLLAHIARYPNAAISEKEQQVEDFVAPSVRKIMYDNLRAFLSQILSQPGSQDLFREWYLHGVCGSTSFFCSVTLGCTLMWKY